MGPLAAGRGHPDGGHRTSPAVPPEDGHRIGGGKPAASHYRVLEDFGFVQLCEIRLETGRTHQIRVHFSSNSHPVVGDAMYGDDQRARGIHTLDRRRADRMVKAAGRQMLHAVELRLVHPATGEDLVFRSEPPADMAAVLEILRETG